MPRRAAQVNLTDVRRLIRAFQREGVDVSATLQPGGVVVLEPAATPATQMPANDLDRELAEFEARNGQG